MFRPLVAAVLLAYLVAPAWAQSAATTPPSAGNPVAKKSGAKAVAKPAAVPTGSGPCKVGVISVIGEHFSVQKFGVTIFEIEFAEIAIDWGLDDLAFARVRAVTGATASVQKIAYPKGAFDPFYHPKSRLFPDPNEGLSAIVRNITPNAHCERYLVITTFAGKLSGTNQLLVGIGAYNQGLGSLIRHSHLFANIALTLIDGKTYEKDNRPFANFGANLAASLRVTEDPLNKLDNSQFPDPPATASSNSVLRDRMRALVAAKLDQVLPSYLKEE